MYRVSICIYISTRYAAEELADISILSNLIREAVLLIYVIDTGTRVIEPVLVVP